MSTNIHALAVERANKEPLPGALAPAFTPCQDIIIGDFKVRKVVGGDYTLIKELNSPVYRQILESRKEAGGEEIEPTDYEKWELIYVMTRPAIESHKLLATGNRKAILELAIPVLSELDLLTLNALFDACVRQFVGNLATMLPYGTKPEGKEGEVNFTPATVASPKMDLAGG